LEGITVIRVLSQITLGHLLSENRFIIGIGIFDESILSSSFAIQKISNADDLARKRAKRKGNVSAVD